MCDSDASEQTYCRPRKKIDKAKYFTDTMKFRYHQHYKEGVFEYLDKNAIVHSFSMLLNYDCLLPNTKTHR